MDSMNHNQGQPQQPQAQNTHDGNAPVMAQNQALPNQVPAHLMGLMANPAMAAAAAAANFPNANMMANPAAFMAMPDAFRMQTGNSGGGIAHNIRGVPMNPSIVTNGFDASQNGSSVQGTNVTPIAPMGNNASFTHNSATGMAMPLVPASCSSVQSHRTDDVSKSRRNDVTADDRARQNRDRNREHARSTRLRKKAYVQKLKELVEGLHAERTEEVRQRRVAVQHLAEKQNVRRAVVRSFLRSHSNFETDDRKWKTILEEDFWLKQPVTPYRSFRRAEIEQVRLFHSPCRTVPTLSHRSLFSP
jgi:ribosome-binding protein aMBF1 (putative translation factor)